jgi:hypothetical protein
MIRILLATGLILIQMQAAFSANDPEATATRVVAALRAQDMNKLARFVHPVKGVRFSPYEYLESTDRVMSAKQVRSKDQQSYYWGQADAADVAIEMNFSSYYREFIYDRDYVYAPRITRNGLLGSGTAINNIRKVYPKSTWIEYHFPPDPGEMNWNSLWLVFEHYQSKWYLVGIVHGAWTI